MVKHDFVLHSGQDFNITYVVPEGSDMNLTGYKGVCKIRRRPNEGVIFELTPIVELKQITFYLSGKASANKQLNCNNLMYDAFIFNENEYIKLGQGRITFIPNISMHD